jgi:hypothetical protein
MRALKRLRRILVFKEDSFFKRDKAKRRNQSTFSGAASNCFTASHQTVNELQEQFLKASKHLQSLRSNFTYSVHAETTAARPASAPLLIPQS